MVEICALQLPGVEFANPIVAASGTFGFGREYMEFYPLSTLGGISCKGITLKERAGNPPPRIAETPSGMLNAVGLQNPGVGLFHQIRLALAEKPREPRLSPILQAILRRSTARWRKSFPIRTLT